MGVTTRWSLPFPELTDVPNAKVATQAIAQALDDALMDDNGTLAARPQSSPAAPGIRGRYFFSTDLQRLDRDTGTTWTDISIPGGAPRFMTVAQFPPSPLYDGMEVYVQIIEGTNWHLRWNDGRQTWDFLDGPPLIAEVATSQTTTSQTFTDLATVGPSITIPRAGYYEVAWGATIASPFNSGAGEYGTAYAAPSGSGVSGPVPSNAVAIIVGNPVGNAAPLKAHVARRRDFALDTGSVVKIQYHSSWTSAANAATFENRWMHISPLYMNRDA